MAEPYLARWDTAEKDRNGTAPEPPGGEPDLLPAPVPWPDPPEEAAWHGVLGEVSRMIEPQTEADPAAVLVQMLVMFGSAIGRGAWWQVENDRHHGNLYCCLVGLTASGRKGTSKGRAMQAFGALEMSEPPDLWATHRVFSGLSSGEGLVFAVRDASYKLHHVKQKGRVVDTQRVLEDSGEPDKRLLVIEPEFGRLLRVMEREGNTLSFRLREAWDSGDLVNLTRGQGGLRATGSHISLIGHTTPVELRSLLSNVQAQNGLGNRFLWLAVRRSKLLPLGGEPIDLGVLRHTIALAVEQARLTGEVGLDSAARQWWCDEVYAQLCAPVPGLVGAITTRAAAQVRRLAMLHALLDFRKDVGTDHLRAALALWDYSARSCCYLFGDGTGDDNADLILDALNRSGPAGLSSCSLHDLFGRHLDRRRLHAALTLLIEVGAVHCHEEQTGGRPKQMWISTAANKANKAKKAAPQGLTVRIKCEESANKGPGPEP
jgi:hypothetical protein